jgi:hypothetical protein
MRMKKFIYYPIFDLLFYIRVREIKSGSFYKIIEKMKRYPVNYTKLQIIRNGYESNKIT